MRAIRTWWPWLVCLAVWAVMIMYCCNRAADYHKGEKIDTVTIVRTDTIKDTLVITQPIETERRVVEYVQMPIVHDTVWRHTPDTVLTADVVTIPIEQVVYEDSTYTAWVSGFKAELDSIRVYNKTINNYIDRTITIRKAAPRLSAGLQGGVGMVGTFNGHQGLGWYAGLGVSYKLFPR